MSKINHQLEANKLQQSLQQARYRAGLIKLNEQFQPWSAYLQRAVEVAASYGIEITLEEAESAIEYLFEINPSACWNLLCCEFEAEDHPALLRGILCDRYPMQLLRLSQAKAATILQALKFQHHKHNRPLTWEEIADVVVFYLQPY